jgi:hypothetical protein
LKKIVNSDIMRAENQHNKKSRPVDSGWEQMSQLLDKEMPLEKKRRRFPLWIWWGTAVLFLIALLPVLSGLFQARQADPQAEPQRSEPVASTPKEETAMPLAGLSEAVVEKTKDKLVSRKEEERRAIGIEQNATQQIPVNHSTAAEKPSELEAQPAIVSHGLAKPLNYLPHRSFLLKANEREMPKMPSLPVEYTLKTSENLISAAFADLNLGITPANLQSAWGQGGLSGQLALSPKAGLSGGLGLLYFRDRFDWQETTLFDDNTAMENLPTGAWVEEYKISGSSSPRLQVAGLFLEGKWGAYYQAFPRLTFSGGLNAGTALFRSVTTVYEWESQSFSGRGMRSVSTSEPISKLRPFFWGGWAQLSWNPKGPWFLSMGYRFNGSNLWREASSVNKPVVYPRGLQLGISYRFF